MTPWSPASMAVAERERRALVTVIAGHIAIVLPNSLTTDSDEDLARLLAKLTRAIDEAIR